MNRYGPRRKGLPASKILTVNDLLFCQEYLANGRNGTRAYMKVHPKASYDTARNNAVGILAKDCVQEHIGLLVRAALPDTIESIKADLLMAEKWAQESGDPAILASVAMDRAKLAGFLVEKREIKEVSDTDRSAIASLVRSTIPNLSSDNLNNS